MALGSLNVRVSKEDFVRRIELVEARMNILQDVIERYGRAKQNVDQFMESDDSNVDAMLARIDESVKTAKKAYSALSETKITLQETVNQMEGMSKEVKETITSATEATKSTVEAAIRISSIL